MSICDSCRLVLQHNRPPSKKRRSSGRESDNADFNNQQPSTDRQVAEELPEVHSTLSLESVSSLDHLQGPYKLNQLNNVLSLLDVSPINSRDLRSAQYKMNKSAEIMESVRRNIFEVKPTDITKADAFDEMMVLLKDKFNSSVDDRECQIKVLSVLLKS